MIDTAGTLECGEALAGAAVGELVKILLEMTLTVLMDCVDNVDETGVCGVRVSVGVSVGVSGAGVSGAGVSEEVSGAGVSVEVSGAGVSVEVSVGVSGAGVSSLVVTLHLLSEHEVTVTLVVLCKVVKSVVGAGVGVVSVVSGVGVEATGASEDEVSPVNGQ